MEHKKPKRKRAKREQPTEQEEEKTPSAMSLSTLQPRSSFNFDLEGQMAATERLSQMELLRASTQQQQQQQQQQQLQQQQQQPQQNWQRYPSELDMLQRSYHQQPAPQNQLFNIQAELLAMQGRRNPYYASGLSGSSDPLARSRSALLSALAMDQQSQPYLERRSLIPSIADMSMPGAAVGLGDSAHSGNIDPYTRMQRDDNVARARSAMLASMAMERSPIVDREAFMLDMADVARTEVAPQIGEREHSRIEYRHSEERKMDQSNVARRKHNIDTDDESKISSSLSSEDVTPSQSEKKRGAAEPFPEKLHRLIREVEQSGKDHIISFSPDGKAFLIHKPDEFFSSIVPKYFKQSRFSSFKRQLNLYGFESVTSGPNKGGYTHEHFVRQDPDLCRQLKRRDVKFNARPKNKLGFDPDAPDFYSMPPIMSSEEARMLAEKQEAGSDDDNDFDSVES